MQELIAKYGVSGTVKVEGQELPIINVPMMSDERWQQLARENAVSNYIKTFGTDPESVEVAVKWQRARINKLQAAG